MTVIMGISKTTQGKCGVGRSKGNFTGHSETWNRPETPILQPKSNCFRFHMSGYC